MDVINLTRELVDIPSVTGDESEVGEYLYDLLERQGWQCRRQEVTSERFNLVAMAGKASVLLTTHLDTVPPFFPSITRKRSLSCSLTPPTYIEISL